MLIRMLICGLTAAVPVRAESIEAAALNARLLAAPPAAVFRTADANPWMDLLRAVGAHGEFSKPFGDTMPIATFGLADRRPDVERQPHKADYINLWGAVDADNKFHPSFVTLVSEDWLAFDPARQTVKPDAVEACAAKKCVFVDQWLFTLELDGSLKRRGDKYDYNHLFVLEDDGGRVYDSGAMQPFATDDEAKAKLAALMAKWQASRPR